MRFTRVVFVVALLALVVAPVALALRFTDDSFTTPTGYTGQPYSHTFHGAAGCGPALPYQYRILSGSLPPGLSLSKDGVISGVPTTAGNYSFWVELSDENPPSASWCIPSTAQREFTIHISSGLNILQNSLSPKGAFIGQPYSFQLTTDNPAAGGTWSVVSGPLPAGITLNSQTGQLSGSPTTAGDYTFKIQVSDGVRSDSETYTLSVVQPLAIGAVPNAAEVGVAYSATPGATGGKPGYAWSLAGGTTLPAGLTLDAATGAISGTPTAPGSDTFELLVTDSLGLTKSQSVPFKVSAKLGLAHKPLLAAKVGAAYSAVLRATGGVAPLKWALLGGRPGSLPAGIKLNVRTGALSGTPKKAGVYRLRFQVTDKLGVHSAAGFVLKVAR
jgi:Putative Ig domain